MTARSRNTRRVRAIFASRYWRELLRPDPAGSGWKGRLVAAFGLWPALNGWAYRLVFLADGRTTRRAAERVLADLRDFAFAGAGRTVFSSDQLEMARRVGRREMFDRIIYHLNLDEDQVQTFMEIEDE